MSPIPHDDQPAPGTELKEQINILCLGQRTRGISTTPHMFTIWRQTVPRYSRVERGKSVLVVHCCTTVPCGHHGTLQTTNSAGGRLAGIGGIRQLGLPLNPDLPLKAGFRRSTPTSGQGQRNLFSLHFAVNGSRAKTIMVLKFARMPLTAKVNGR